MLEGHGCGLQLLRGLAGRDFDDDRQGALIADAEPRVDGVGGAALRRLGWERTHSGSSELETQHRDREDGKHRQG